jgi:multiple sugar transport system substrate-binding protein
VPIERQKAALEFLTWFQTLDHQLAYTRYGAVPVRVDLGQTPLARDPKFRFLKAQSDNSRVAKMYAVIPEAAQMSSIVSLRLNECIIGKSAPAEALNRAAAEVQDLIARSGRKTGRLPDLK